MATPPTSSSAAQNATTASPPVADTPPAHAADDGNSTTPPDSGSAPPPTSPPVATTPVLSPPPVSPSPPVTTAPPSQSVTSPPAPNMSTPSTGMSPVTSSPPAPATATPSLGTPAIASPPPPSESSSSTSSPSDQSPARSSPGRSSTTTHSPPPPSHKSGSSSSSSRDSGTSSDGASAAVIIGAVVGAGVLLLLIAMAFWVCCCQKNKKKRMDNYNAYYNAGGLPTKWQPNAGLSDPMKPPGTLPPPPGSWGQMPPYPPTPPQGNMSSDMSSSGPQGPPLPPPSPSVALNFASKSSFSYDELSAATNGFSQGNLIGQGGFGYVFKGLLPNGKEVAIKQLKAGSGQGEREFQAEVDIISRVHHRHLVSLVGYCMAGAQRLLVYEFVTNGTLEYHLHGKDVPTMDWPTRLKIALGSAKGLAYLHEDCHPRIIHRDIKSANILLEQNFEAKVADFGLAKFTEDTNTHVSTRIMGTFGYLAPEYASSGKLTEKSDVFSFGVMLLELITGRKPVDLSMMEDSLVDWARPLMMNAVSEEKFDELVDPKLENNFNTVEMQRLIASAASCVRHSARRRPKMSQIVRALEGDVSLEDLNEGGVKPGQSMFFSSSSDYDSGSYTSNINRFRKVALDSTEYTNEYSHTSEYGLNLSESSSSGEMSGNNTQKHQH